MNPKGIMLLHYKDKQRKLNFVTHEGALLAITHGDSNKVAFMNENDQVNLQFGKDIVSATPEIISNPKEVQELYEFMESEDNNHYPKYQDDFVAVKFHLNNK
ncbi:MAG: hypothetical protein AB7E61_07825 [Acholeplasmataceae bacterium]